MGVHEVLSAADIVGESAVWDDRNNRLVWVDIIGRRVQAFSPSTGQHDIWTISARPTSIGLCEDGRAIIGTERHICFWDWQGDPQPVVEVEPDLPANRLNEGVVGPDGAFWVGTMLNNIGDDDSPRDIPQATGRIYRYESRGGITQVGSDRFGIVNTLAFPAPCQLVTADTLANAIYSYRIAPNGQLTDRRALFSGYARGLPDGSCLDNRGRLWTARVAGGACLTCVNAEGELEEVVNLPCSWPTSCAFGGPNLATLFVTSARFTMSGDHLAANPQEGAVFALDVGVAGHPSHRFGVRP